MVGERDRVVLRALAETLMATDIRVALKALARGARQAVGAHCSGFTHEDEEAFTVFSRLCAALLDRLYTHRRLRQAYGEFVWGMAKASCLYGLSEKECEGLTNLGRALLVRLGITGELLDLLAFSVAAANVGLLFIPPHLVQLRPDLTPEEEKVWRTHIVKGAALFQKSPYHIAAHDAALYHHEHWDGTGFPKGLRGEEIPFSGRVAQVLWTIWESGDLTRLFPEVPRE